MKFRRPFKLLSVRELLGELTLGTFIERVNRFCAVVRTKGKICRAHISDTGRLKELLIPGAKVLLAENPSGKLDYKLVAVRGSDDWIFLYTPLHSLVAEELIKGGFLGFYPEEVKKEVKCGKSRIDFLIDGNFYLEVKGCNLLKETACLFPDAPTERGKKHLEELISLREKGFRTGILFLAFRQCDCFSPNADVDNEFAKSFERALSSGVEFFGAKLKFLPETGGIYLDGELPLC